MFPAYLVFRRSHVRLFTGSPELSICDFFPKKKFLRPEGKMFLKNHILVELEDRIWLEIITIPFEMCKIGRKLPKSSINRSLKFVGKIECIKWHDLPNKINLFSVSCIVFCFEQASLHCLFRRTLYIFAENYNVKFFFLFWFLKTRQCLQ